MNASLFALVDEPSQLPSSVSGREVAQAAEVARLQNERARREALERGH
jgi:hypothetical protein